MRPRRRRDLRPGQLPDRLQPRFEKDPDDRYDLTGGMLGELWNGGVGGSSCLANDVPVEGWDDLRPDPMPGAGYYYLVRAQSACGNGTYGSDSLGRERQPGANCP